MEVLMKGWPEGACPISGYTVTCWTWAAAGGGNIDRMLSMDGVSTVKGIDYSDVSVSKSREVNSVAISKGRCEILQGM